MSNALRRRPVWILGAAAAALTIAFVVVLVAGRSDRHDPCAAPRTAPPAEVSLMPQGLSFDRIGTVTRVRKEGRHVIVQAVSTKPLDELTVLIQDAVTAAGYRPAGMDNEGFEAEVFFTTGSFAAGQALVRATACKGRWDVDLVLVRRRAAAA